MKNAPRGLFSRFLGMGSALLAAFLAGALLTYALIVFGGGPPSARQTVPPPPVTAGVRADALRPPQTPPNATEAAGPAAGAAATAAAATERAFAQLLTPFQPMPPATAEVATPAGMVLVPSGYFLMGSAGGPPNEQPAHPVLLDAFFLDQFEVTNADYQRCVDAGSCAPSGTASYTRLDYTRNSLYARYPAVNVNWDDASRYCAWAGKRLPTEAEWEYAASGPENHTYPWGNFFDLNLSAASAEDTQPVDSYPAGASPFGVFNLAGNVAEWVADVYVPELYAASPALNPLGQGDSELRIYRGGSFGSDNSALYTTSRREVVPDYFQTVQVGFRCAASVPDQSEAALQLSRAAWLPEFCPLYARYRPGAACP